MPVLLCRRWYVAGNEQICRLLIRYPYQVQLFRFTMTRVWKKRTLSVVNCAPPSRTAGKIRKVFAVPYITEPVAVYGLTMVYRAFPIGPKGLICALPGETGTADAEWAFRTDNCPGALETKRQSRRNYLVKYRFDRGRPQRRLFEASFFSEAVNRMLQRACLDSHTRTIRHIVTINKWRIIWQPAM